ncbi:MAG: S-adenosylhomocysteine deaminase [Clostridiales bacterium]|jgi:cytosine/adenosine deaminase-related metal-dependent hydrolase|nr:S-adenosylhomocysteine deaminase [Clostridiales bacterium]
MKRLLIKNADWIITMNSKKERLKNTDIIIEDNVISKIGKNLDKDGVFDEIIDATGMIALPGFVNTHHHCFQSLVRNITVANGLHLEPWLVAVYDIFQDLTPEAVEAGATVALGELLKTGCTTSQDHHYAFPNNRDEYLIDAEIKSARKLGIRFHPTRGSITKDDLPHSQKTLVGDEDDILTDSERLIKTYHDSNRYSMLRMGLAPCWHGFDTTERLMNETLQLARKYEGVYCHTHLGESKAEAALCIEKFGCRPIEYVRRLGWLGKDIYFAHGVQFNDEEVKVIAETGTGIAHCPNSNMYLNSGVCRVPDLLEAGANIGLAVDGSASNNSSNMMTEIRTAYLVHRLTYGNKAPTAEQILEIATFRGAKVLGRDDIGRLAPNMAADIVLMNWKQLQYAGGCNDPVASIVMSGDSRMVDTVLVNGKVVVKKGNLTTIDEQKETEWVNRVGKNMLRRASARVKGLDQDLD